jgi:hypothetical protein
MLARLLVVALTFFPLAARVCDLCACYTRQLESMPKAKNSMSRFYTAIAEQFTYLVRFNSTIMRLPIPPGSAWTVQSPNS